MKPLLVVLLLSNGLVCAADVCAQQQHPPLDLPFPLTAPGVEYLQRTLGITAEDAARRLAIQSAYEGGEFEAEFPGRYAGEYISQTPAQHVVVRLTGATSVATREIPTVAGPMPVEFEVGAHDTASELRVKADHARIALKRFYPQVSNTAIDIPSGSVIVWVNVRDRTELAEFSRRELKNIETVVQAPIKLRGGR